MYKEQLDKDFTKTLKLLKSQQKDQSVISNNRKEYVNMDRFIRATQVGFTQIDQTVGSGNKAKTVLATRIAINFQKEIVKKSVAFEVGNPPTVTPIEQTDLSQLAIDTWNDCRLDYRLQEAFEIRKSETESAFLFHFKTNSDNIREIKCRLLSHKIGVMSAHFDEFGGMDAFVWDFTSKVGDKDVKNTWVYDELNLYKFSDEVGGFGFVEEIPHGFTKIPVVYLAQDFNEWKDVETIIDRNETSISRLVESNDYSGHPILAIFGEVTDMMDKNDSGKTLNFPIETTADGKPVMGDAKFITNDNAPDSVKLELDYENSLIYKITQTPNLSFDNLKGLGSVSGVALEFMFLDAILKAKGNEGENRTIIERCLSIITDGIVSVISVGLKSQLPLLRWNIKFNSILPNDTTTLIDDMSKGVESGIISIDTAVKEIGLTEDTELEIQKIKDEKTV